MFVTSTPFGFSNGNSFFFFHLVVVVVQSQSHVLLLRPHGLQPARLLRPWDSPGKNIRVGCHFLLHLEPLTENVSFITSLDQWAELFSSSARKWPVLSKSSLLAYSAAQSCPTLCSPMDCSLPGSLAHEISQERWIGLPFPSVASLHELVPNLSYCLTVVESHIFCPYKALKFHSSTDQDANISLINYPSFSIYI